MAGSHSNALEVLLEEYSRLEQEAVEALASGADCKKYADYRYRCGIIHGLRMSLRELLDLKKRIEEA
jgi:hypothetical protein